MNITRIHWIIVILTLVCAPGAYAAIPSSPDLKFSLRVDRTDVYVSEPLTVTAIVKNTSKNAIKVPYFWSALSVEVAFENGNFSVWQDGPHAGLFMGGEIEIPAGAAVGETMVLCFRHVDSGEETIFRREGTYRLRARAVAGATEWSPEVSVTVKELPKEEISVAIAAQVDAAEMLHGNWSHEGVRRLENLLEDFPKSICADRAHYVLGELYSDQLRDPLVYPDVAIQIARSHFAAVTDRQPGQKLQALFGEARTLAKEKDVKPQDAKALFDALKKNQKLAIELGFEKELNEAITSPVFKTKSE